MAEKDPNQMAAEKLDKETKKVQAEQAASLEQASEKVRQGKMRPPTNDDMGPLLKKNSKGAGIVKSYKKGGSVSSASKRADGCATKGKTKGRII